MSYEDLFAMKNMRTIIQIGGRGGLLFPKNGRVRVCVQNVLKHDFRVDAVKHHSGYTGSLMIKDRFKKQSKLEDLVEVRTGKFVFSLKTHVGLGCYMLKGVYINLCFKMHIYTIFVKQV